MASKVESILEEIKGLTLLEAADLVKKMEEAFGVSAAAAAPVAPANPPARGSPAPPLPDRPVDDRPGPAPADCERSIRHGGLV